MLPSLAFFIAAFVLAVTPGPGIAYVVARTAAGVGAEGLASCIGTGSAAACSTWAPPRWACRCYWLSQPWPSLRQVHRRGLLGLPRHPLASVQRQLPHRFEPSQRARAGLCCEGILGRGAQRQNRTVRSRVSAAVPVHRSLGRRAACRHGHSLRRAQHAGRCRGRSRCSAAAQRPRRQGGSARGCSARRPGSHSSTSLACGGIAARRLTPPSSGRSKGRFAPFGPPLMSNVRPHCDAPVHCGIGGQHAVSA